MKTETRSDILKLIEKRGPLRPSEVRRTLNLSPQIIHRHLKTLVAQGLVEVKGSTPFTQYALAGIPNLEAVSEWMNARIPTNNPELVCETRDIFTARLPRLKSFVDEGLTQETLPLVISTTAEIGNNSFDHNSGQWRDVPGCWFETQATGKHLWICIADRGQGIFKSLSQVHPNLTNDQTALKAAFETIISGRAPERRGNGLKFARKNLTDTPDGGIACISGSGRVAYGKQGVKCLALLERTLTNVHGTITLMTWSLK